MSEFITLEIGSLVEQVASAPLYGTGAPDDELGVNGQTYLDTDAGQWYEKVDGTWELRYTDVAGTSGGAAGGALTGTYPDPGLAAGIDAAKLADGSVSNAEFQRLNGVTSAIQTQIDGKAASIHTHAQSDVTGLTGALAAKADLVGGVVPTAQIPAIAITDFLGTVGSQAAMLALSGQKGDWAIRSDTGTVWVISGADPTILADWTEMPGAGAPVTSVNSQTGTVVLDAGDVGAYTTSEVDTALALKASKSANLSDLANAGTARSNLGLGTAAVLNVPSSGNAASGEVVKGSDTRLTDARTPTTHSHTASDVTNFSEAVDDRVNALVVPGTAMQTKYDDAGNALKLHATFPPPLITAGNPANPMPAGIKLRGSSLIVRPTDTWWDDLLVADFDWTEIKEQIDLILSVGCNLVSMKGSYTYVTNGTYLTVDATRLAEYAANLNQIFSYIASKGAFIEFGFSGHYEYRYNTGGPGGTLANGGVANFLPIITAIVEVANRYRQNFLGFDLLNEAGLWYDGASFNPDLTTFENTLAALYNHVKGLTDIPCSVSLSARISETCPTWNTVSGFTAVTGWTGANAQQFTNSGMAVNLVDAVAPYCDYMTGHPYKYGSWDGPTLAEVEDFYQAYEKPIFFGEYGGNRSGGTGVADRTENARLVALACQLPFVIGATQFAVKDFGASDTDAFSYGLFDGSNVLRSDIGDSIVKVPRRKTTHRVVHTLPAMQTLTGSFAEVAGFNVDVFVAAACRFKIVVFADISWSNSGDIVQGFARLDGTNVVPGVTAGGSATDGRTSMIIFQEGVWGPGTHNVSSVWIRAVGSGGVAPQMWNATSYYLIEMEEL